MDICTLAIEFNYTNKPKSQGTVWIFCGDGRCDLAGDEQLQDLAGWTRIAGPLPYDAATSIHAALRDFLVRSGVTVFDEGIAD